jgi:predicted nucleic acid-binding protein
MFLLDTNVVSAIRQRGREPLAWLLRVHLGDCWLSVISLGELEKGVVFAKKRDLVFATRLQGWHETLRDQFAARTLPIDTATALAWGEIAAGRSRGVADALIAATAIVHDLTLVTRNTRDFDDLPLKLFNPWGD